MGREAQKVVKGKVDIEKFTEKEEKAIGNQRASEMAAKHAAKKRKENHKKQRKTGAKAKEAGEKQANALVLQIRAREAVGKKKAKVKAMKAAKAKAKAVVDERMNKLKVDAASLRSLNKNVRKKANQINKRLVLEEAARVAAKAADDKTQAAKTVERKKKRDSLSAEIAKQEQSKEESSKEYFAAVKSIQKQQKMQYSHAVNIAKQIGVEVQKYEKSILDLTGKIKGEPNEHTQATYTKDLKSESVKLAKARDRFGVARQQMEAIKAEQRSAQKSMDQVAKDCIGNGCRAFETSAKAKKNSC